jgi:RNA polymerase sigma factor for flagellar operon FliA
MSRPPADNTPLTAEQHALILSAGPMIQRTAAWVARGIPGTPHEDLVAAGQLAAAGPARRFEERRGLRFEDYANKAVRGAMIRLAVKQARFTDLERELILQMIDGVPEARPDDPAVNAPPSARILAETEEHDAIGAGMLLGAASGEATSPESAVIKKRLLDALERSRHKLSDQEQRIVTMHHMEEMALEKVGEALGVGRTTIKARHRRALVRLRAFMDPWA